LCTYTLETRLFLKPGAATACDSGSVVAAADDAAASARTAANTNIGMLDVRATLELRIKFREEFGVAVHTDRARRDPLRRPVSDALRVPTAVG
jgi:hypothetical protein